VPGVFKIQHKCKHKNGVLEPIRGGGWLAGTEKKKRATRSIPVGGGCSIVSGRR
jgi:hypothetical protein